MSIIYFAEFESSLMSFPTTLGFVYNKNLGKVIGKVAVARRLSGLTQVYFDIVNYEDRNSELEFITSDFRVPIEKDFVRSIDSAKLDAQQVIENNQDMKAYGIIL
jgi:hypothetical protein